MNKYWAWKLKGTILEEEDKKTETGGFLDPWSSLVPEFTREKLSPDVIAVFKDGQTQLNGLSEVEQAKMPFWALLFPKRSYLPPDFPHLQLWYLSQNFVPSFQFVNLRQRKVMLRAVKKIKSAYEHISEKHSKYQGTRPALAINATPFSFIKNEEGEYYAGGQSVRTFHLHFLAIPNDLPKKEMTEKEAVLVYPTKFGHQLFKLIFSNPEIQHYIFEDQESTIKITERGIRFFWPGSLEELISVIGRLDELMYQLQLSLIYAFYQDSETFLAKVAEFARTDSLQKIEGKLEKLILLGYERSLPVTKRLINKELHRLGRKYQAKFSNADINQVADCLINNEDGDLASTVGSQKVVLRPGMGYGTMIWLKGSKFEIDIAPLDSLRSEGTMESNGFYFTEKVKVNQKPEWLEKILNYLTPD